ncbi:MAG: glycoside hydrolase family 9 protein [Ruminococcus sp.]|nr:glycoside hydrolase family 9 protein [Ruminococcus sp.]
MSKGKLKNKLAALTASAVMAVSSIPAASLSASAADKNYYEALAMSLYFFDSNACGTGITDGPLTWRGDCHTYDATASVGSLDGSLKSVVDPDGDGKVDVSGGWHDAGDHIKFNLTIGFGLSSLGMSEYLNEGIYSKAGAWDHLAYEMRWGADYLMKTTYLDDSGNVAAIAHVVADGGTDHSFWTSPEVQTYDRPVFWLTASQNNSAVCGEMACGLLATAYVLQNDPEYSAKCIKYAKALIDFGKKHTGNETGGLGSFYGTDSMYEDEMALASAWLYILGEGDIPTLKPNAGQYNGIYDYYLYSWDKVWQGYAALMYKATGDKAFAEELKFELNNQGGLSEGNYNANGWGASRYNCAKQMNSYLLADGDPNSSFAKAAKYQIDTILGDNNLGYSFLLGFGDKWPTHIHHRAANPGGDGVTSAQNPEAKYTNYGMLVGGIDGSGYEDHADRYQYTEGALDYNGCFAIACAFAANLYGGDASTFDSIKSSASEINADFKFGSGSVTPPDDTTTTTTTETTTETTTTETTTTETIQTTTQTTTSTMETTTTETQTTVVGSDQKIQHFVDLITEIGDNTVTFQTKGTFTVSKAKDMEKIKAIGTGKSVDIEFLDYKDTTIMVINSINVMGTGGDTIKYGDANEDGKVSLADAVLIMQALSNPDEYKLSETAQKNADVVDVGDGVSPKDALAIQLIDLQKFNESDLPLTSDQLNSTD